MSRRRKDFFVELAHAAWTVGRWTVRAVANYVAPAPGPPVPDRVPKWERWLRTFRSRQ